MTPQLPPDSDPSRPPSDNTVSKPTAVHEADQAAGYAPGLPDDPRDWPTPWFPREQAPPPNWNWRDRLRSFPDRDVETAYTHDLTAIDGTVSQRTSQTTLVGYSDRTLRDALTNTCLALHTDALNDDTRATLVAEAIDILVILRRRAQAALDRTCSATPYAVTQSSLDPDPDDSLYEKYDTDDRDASNAFDMAIGSM